MAEIVPTSKNVKKRILSSGWTEQFSKSYPDKTFYFNERTGESRWSPPLEIQEKVMESVRKGRKRKLSDKESEESSDINSDVTNSLKNPSTPNRYKLKAKSTKAIASDIKQSDVDTPAMRLYREKLAKRKAALETKKNTPKTPKQKQNKVLTPPPKILPQATSSPSVSQIQSRRRRTCSSVSSNNNVSSNYVDISCTEIAEVKTKQTSPILKTPNRITRRSTQTLENKLSKIPKTQLYNTISISPKSNISDRETVVMNINNETLDDSTETIITRTPQKNSAKNRMEGLRKSLNSGKDKGSPAKRFHRVSNNNKVNNSSVDKSKLSNPPTPILCKYAHTRLNSLENRMRHSGLLEISKSMKEKNNDEESVKNKEILDKIENADAQCEQMEWASNEDEMIMSELHSVRYQLCKNPLEKLNQFSSNTLQSLNNPEEKHALYIVIDTNVFLSNLPLIEEIRDSYSEMFDKPFIVIPWVVLQELDFIKDNRRNTSTQALKQKARHAVEFLNKHFAVKHPRFLGQKPMSLEQNKKFVADCPDDEILQICLQIKESSKSPVLLSYDKNLCNKAMVHDIPVLSRNDPLEKIYYLKAAETSLFLSNSLHIQTDHKLEDISAFQKELMAADDIMEDGKAVLKAILSEVVAKEMENLFGERWEMHVIIRPPWSIVTVLKCTLKHWMAAISESFTRRTESMLRDLLHCINEVPDGGRKLQHVQFFLDKCSDVIQTLNELKYPVLKEKILTQIDELKKTCLNKIEELKAERFKESVGNELDPDEEERRATLAFKVFEEIYAFARDTCGFIADAIGLPCSFSYDKMHPYLTTKIAIQHERDVSVNVNKLLQALRTALSKLNDGTGLDNKIVLALYNILINFSSNLSFDELKEMTPLDIYCCLKLKKAKFEKGYEQLQELAIHFCQIANHRCL